MEESNARREDYFANILDQDEDSSSGECADTWSKEEDDSEVLEIGFDTYRPRDGNWERYGHVIGRMKRLRELLFYDLDEEDMRGDFASIFDGISCNRSIRDLRFHWCGFMDQDVFSKLTPFFKNNVDFESLKIDGCDLGRDGLRFLTKALMGFGSLKEFQLFQCGKDDEGSYIQALLGHSGLRKLSLHATRIGRDGFLALAGLLRKPGTELAEVALTDNVLDDAAVAILETGTAGNSTLSVLDLQRNPSITEKGWGVIFATLRKPECRLETLLLQGNRINDSAEVSLTDSLFVNDTLKVLDLSCRHVSNGRALFKFLRSPSCTLEELCLVDNRFGEGTAVYLAYFLLHNRSLKILDLSACRFTNTGWKALSLVLRDPHSTLENLCLSSCEMNDEAASYIANGLASNIGLRDLGLRNNFRITAVGWEVLFSALRQPNSALEKLDISGSNVNDDIMISLADSLAVNKKLIEVDAGPMNWDITNQGWAALSRILCNKSSILSTHRSNHTLQKLCKEDTEISLPKDIRSLLALNREHSKSQAARRKIIKTHFNHGSHIDILPFANMKSKVYPFVLAWMAGERTMDTKRTCGNGFSLLYQFVQSITLLFEFDGNDNSWVGNSRAKRRKVV